MKVLYFSTARVATNLASEDVPLDAPTDADGVWTQLVARHPALGPLRGGSRISRNDEYATAETIFSDGDVVAVIPPVSGG